ncbi:Coenzyme F420 hydrogenase/dehydrogenase, beta subunit C-terminal domain [Aquamicrobium sp. LC103]|uniref:Coenzyme F420 hydrogenase/dehydrogenase, beta subunit C-terminal domain n=1 Tax=Aquamicrobium sp. LC103 TaxID=1120658 RepID=UPI00069B9DFB|nr:Coenzyme F420 hydrogenase/dehydrogenase, beta subunit C-terminal domain [Aquamicrobium sp. LC103]TKT75732.1 coenzyme F420 hydrogenase [Aquamicrobium sp. LC103]
MRAGSVNDIVANGLCTGCGACESIAGRGSMRMGLSPEGFMRPRLVGRLERATEERALAVCTGRSMPRPPAAEGPVHRIFGRILHMGRGHATDPTIRFRGATGGVLTALATFLIESGRVEGVLHVGTTREDPMATEPRLSSTRAEVLAASGSRYGPAAPLRMVGELLDAGRLFAFIGKPCDVATLRRMALTDPRIDRQVPYMLAMFCGGSPSIDATHNVVRRFGAEPSQVTAFRYRGHGWPGPTFVRTANGQEFRQTYDETWFSGLRYELMFRCKVCTDGISEHADVVAGDCWVMENGKPTHREVGDGWNIEIARTQRGAELLKAAITAGFLHEEPFSIPELEAMHDDHGLKKRSVFWRLAGLALTARPRPRHSGHRVVRAGLLEASPREAWSAFSGVVTRLLKGRNHESPITAPARAAIESGD